MAYVSNEERVSKRLAAAFIFSEAVRAAIKEASKIISLGISRDAAEEVIDELIHALTLKIYDIGFEAAESEAPCTPDIELMGLASAIPGGDLVSDVDRHRFSIRAARYLIDEFGDDPVYGGAFAEDDDEAAND